MQVFWVAVRRANTHSSSNNYQTTKFSQLENSIPCREDIFFSFYYNSFSWTFKQCEIYIICTYLAYSNAALTALLWMYLTSGLSWERTWIHTDTLTSSSLLLSLSLSSIRFFSHHAQEQNFKKTRILSSNMSISTTRNSSRTLS